MSGSGNNCRCSAHLGDDGCHRGDRRSPRFPKGVARANDAEIAVSVIRSD